MDRRQYAQAAWPRNLPATWTAWIVARRTRTKLTLSCGDAMADFVHEIEIAADAESVRNLIASHGDQWWTTNATIDDREGGTCAFRFPSAGFHALVRLTRNASDLVEWRCIDSTLSPTSLKASGGTDPREWVGTTIRFHLTPLEYARTRLRLEHLGLGASAEFYSTQNNVWAFYLESLRSLAETGQGSPFQGGRPGTDNSQQELNGVPMPIYTIAEYQVKPSGVDKVRRAIEEFVPYVQSQEPGTRMYTAWQCQDDPTKFVHFFIFEDEAAHAAHSRSAAVKQFEAAYGPELVSKGVKFTDYKLIASKGP
jgi:quinol monooxygenase YgiN